MQPAIFLMGPTAAGKTDLAVRLATEHNCEIISVDSALIYQGMDIGTAKPDAATLAQAPHHLISFLDPSQSYSAAEFRRDALALMADISARGKIPLLVGGTMMYFKFLRDGAADLPSSVPEVRERLQMLGEAQGWPYLHQQLAKVDPASAARLEPTDSQRLMRALEVYEISGRTLTEFWAQQEEQKLHYQVFSLAVSPAQRSLLHQRIAQRFDLMLEQGFEHEVQALYQRGDLHLDLPAIRCVGYRQMWQYLDGKYRYEEMRERGIIATRQLAKRQITWLRSWPDLHWLDSQDTNILRSALKIPGLDTILS